MAERRAVDLTLEGWKMKEQQSVALVRQIIIDVATQTGFEPRSKAPRRYLWTDAFGVCNVLALYRQSGDDSSNCLLTLFEQGSIPYAATIHSGRF